MEIDEGDTLFGLYQGTPLPQREWSYGNALPDRISIFQRPIEEACSDDEEIRDCVAETVIHEFGHYFGMSEEEIEEIEEKYWRGEPLDDV
jgi:predicted Zn-dependent protease with MMP-like domain